jgi:hypothetical protein
MSEKIAKQNITHKELCIATAKRFIKKVALYDYHCASIIEHPDVLILDGYCSTLFEIKVSLSDFHADKYKACRKKYRFPMWMDGHNHLLDDKSCVIEKPTKKKSMAWLKMVFGTPEVELLEKEHLGNFRYFVSPAGIIPVEKLPEGWGLYYYKNGKFFLKKKSGKFRPNMRRENILVAHALRRFASGDSTGILVNTYGDKE